MNEINHIAFGELTEEYHNELCGYIESEGQIGAFLDGQLDMLSYTRLNKNGDEKQETRKLPHYVRDQIHHPGNTSNPRFSEEQIRQSPSEMRNFIDKNINKLTGSSVDTIA